MNAVPPPVRAVLCDRRLSLCLLVRAGSKAYGIEVEGSDDDFVGVFVPSLDDFLSLRGFGPETHAGRDPDFTLHELGKFCRLALKAGSCSRPGRIRPSRAGCGCRRSMSPTT